VKVCYGFHIKTAAVDVVRGTPPLAAKIKTVTPRRNTKTKRRVGSGRQSRLSVFFSN